MYTDNRWNHTAGRTEEQLIQENPKLKEAIDNLKGYTPSQSEFSLFTMTYIEWEWHCQHSSIAKMNRIAEDNNPINTLANVQLFYMIISFLSLMIIGLISPGFIMYKQILNLLGKPEADKDIIASNGMRLIAGIFIVLKGCFLISAMVIIKNFTHIVDYVEEHNCTDSTTLAIFQFLRGVLLDAYDQNKYGLITVGIMAGCEIIATLILCILSCIVRRQNANRNNHLFTDPKKKKI